MTFDVQDEVFIKGQSIGFISNYNICTSTLGRTVTTLEIVSTSPPAAPLVKAADVIWGTPGMKLPYRGHLVGNIRIVYRHNDYAKIYVRDPHRIRQFLLKPDGDYVTHGIELAQNHRINPRPHTP